MFGDLLGGVCLSSLPVLSRISYTCISANINLMSCISCSFTLSFLWKFIPAEFCSLHLVMKGVAKQFLKKKYIYTYK